MQIRSYCLFIWKIDKETNWVELNKIVPMCVIQDVLILTIQLLSKILEWTATKDPMSLKEMEQADNNHVTLTALFSPPVCSHPGPSDFVLWMFRQCAWGWTNLFIAVIMTCHVANLKDTCLSNGWRNQTPVTLSVNHSVKKRPQNIKALQVVAKKNKRNAEGRCITHKTLKILQVMCFCCSKCTSIRFYILQSADNTFLLKMKILFENIEHKFILACK